MQFQIWDASEFVPQHRTRAIILLRNLEKKDPTMRLCQQCSFFQGPKLCDFGMPWIMPEIVMEFLRVPEDILEILLNPKRTPSNYHRVWHPMGTSQTLLHSYTESHRYNKVLGQIVRTEGNRYRWIHPAECLTLQGFPAILVTKVWKCLAAPRMQEFKYWWEAAGNTLPIPILRQCLAAMFPTLELPPDYSARYAAVMHKLLTKSG